MGQTGLLIGRFDDELDAFVFDQQRSLRHRPLAAREPLLRKQWYQRRSSFQRSPARRSPPRSRSARSPSRTRSRLHFGLALFRKIKKIYKKKKTIKSLLTIYDTITLTSTTIIFFLIELKN